MMTAGHEDLFENFLWCLHTRTHWASWETKQVLVQLNFTPFRFIRFQKEKENKN